jgi:hypothetical protein
MARSEAFPCCRSDAPRTACVVTPRRLLAGAGGLALGVTARPGFARPSMVVKREKERNNGYQAERPESDSREGSSVRAPPRFLDRRGFRFASIHVALPYERS